MESTNTDNKASKSKLGDARASKVTLWRKTELSNEMARDCSGFEGRASAGALRLRAFGMELEPKGLTSWHPLNFLQLHSWGRDALMSTNHYKEYQQTTGDYYCYYSTNPD